MIRGPLPLFQEFSWLSLVHCLQNCFLPLPDPQLGPLEQQVSRRKHGQERAAPGVNCSKAWENARAAGGKTSHVPMSTHLRARARAPHLVPGVLFLRKKQ